LVIIPSTVVNIFSAKLLITCHKCAKKGFNGKTQITQKGKRDGAEKAFLSRYKPYRKICPIIKIKCLRKDGTAILATLFADNLK